MQPCPTTLPAEAAQWCEKGEHGEEEKGRTAKPTYQPVLAFIAIPGAPCTLLCSSHQLCVQLLAFTSRLAKLLNHGLACLELLRGQQRRTLMKMIMEKRVTCYLGWHTRV